MRERKINLEILRIMCTIMIIAFHYVFYGKAGLYDDFAINSFTSLFICHLGELGVNCFILISGYFMSETIFKPKKIILIVLQIEFYILLSKVVLILFGEQTQWDLIQFFPILKGGYWFIHAYLLLYILQPFLNKMLKALDRKEFLALIMSQAFIWSVVPSVFLVTVFKYTTPEQMPFYNRYIWMIIMYCIGFFIRQYGLPELKRDPLHIKDAKPWMVVILPYELLILFIILGEHGFWPYNPTFFRTPNSTLMLLMSLALFYPFISYKYIGKHEKTIRTVSSCSLGIYLFHDGELRTFLWEKAFLYIKTDNCFFYIGQVLAATIVVFAAGIVIERIRQMAETKTVCPIIDRVGF